jgi:hypothetical protein
MQGNYDSITGILDAQTSPIMPAIIRDCDHRAVIIYNGTAIIAVAVILARCALSRRCIRRCRSLHRRWAKNGR